MSYSRDDILTPKQVQEALKLGDTTWKHVRHRLPFSYAFGPRSARITWGQVLDAMQSEDQLAQRRRAS